MRKLIALIFVIAFLITSCFMLTEAEAQVEEKKLLVPSPIEIRDFEPQSNRLMIITYANGRVFIYRIENISPKPDCNQIKFDEQRRIRITTQAISQAYEYILEPMPIMVSEWVSYEE